MNDSHDAAKSFLVQHVSAAGRTSSQDVVAIEEPMEIRVVYGPPDARSMRSLSITMRTPGHERELAAGFLFTEGILTSPDQIDSIGYRGTDADGKLTGNIVRVDLQPDQTVDMKKLQRHFFTTSSCGVCGKASLEALEVQGLKPLHSDLQVTAAVIKSLPERLRAQQETFDRTGGLHAAGLAVASGEVVAVMEDVGRHNAVDKLIGHEFLAGRTALSQNVMVISGRASFEILQKALVAGVPVIVAVGAPSSLAVEMAEKYQMTLAGFTSADRFNIYSAGHRIE